MTQLSNPYYEEPEKDDDKPSGSGTNTPVIQIPPTQTNPGTGTTQTPAGSVSTGTSGGQTAKPTGNGSTTSKTEETEKDPSAVKPVEDTEKESNPFTPEGTGTVLDEATGEGDDKQFYTITTEAGNVFYLIIDGKRDDNNVYFLNGVTEADLMALADDGEPAACSCTTRCQAGAVSMNCEICASDMTACAGPEPEPEPEETPAAEETEPEPEEESGGMGSLLIILLIAALAGGGAFYYIKFIKNKPKTKGDTDLDDYDYGEDEEPAGEENMDDEFTMDAEPEDEKL